MTTETNNQTTGRFQIGQEIYVMTSVSQDRNYAYPILSSVANGEAKLFFKKLTVTEHHKVTNGYSEEKEYDGYLLTDGETTFSNQYPVASYGQVSDEANYLFSAGLYNKSDEEVREAFKDQANNPIFWVSITNILSYLAGVQRTGRAAKVVGKAVGIIFAEFEKAIPGKTLMVHDSKVGSSEIVSVEVEDKTN